jgi:sporulation protein YlmC with PRC-barrel domain
MKRVHSERKTFRKAAIAVAATLSVSTIALAQTSPGPGTAPAPSAAPGIEKQNRSVAPREMRLSKLIGADVNNTSAKDIGDVRDVVIDANSGRVHYLVLEYGGFLGMGEKLFAYPMTSFRVADRAALVLDVSEDRLRAAPGFDRKRWPDWNSEYRGSVDRFFGARGDAVQNARFVRGSQLLDAELRSKGGEDIGDVEDVVVDLSTGQVGYIVVEFDRGWFKSDKLVALPMRAFEPVRERGTFASDLVLSIDKSRLQDAPTFSRDDWPESGAFRRQVDRYSTGMGRTDGSPAAPNAARDGVRERATPRGDQTSSR